MSDRPQARMDDLVVEEVDDGVVVYDRRTETAHWLDSSAAKVWRHADGSRELSQIAVDTELSAATVAEVVDRLEGLDLVLGGSDDGVSRRAALRKVAKIGGTAAILAPVISSVVVPDALATASVCDKISCSGTSFTSCTTAHNNANTFCHGQTGCRSTSTCNGTCTTGTPNRWSGTCSF